MIGKEILLVDDDPNDVELALAALAEHNLANRVVVAWDGREGSTTCTGADDLPAVPPCQGHRFGGE